MDLSDFDYILPEDLIAQSPANPRGASRLLYVNQHGLCEDLYFERIIDLLRKGDVLILNNTKVLPALLSCRRKNDVAPSRIHITLIKQILGTKWQILAKPAKKLSVGMVLEFLDDQGPSMEAVVIEKNAQRNYIVLDFQLSEEEMFKILLKSGKMPLPPYIKRQERGGQSDDINYQTIYAKEYGAVAAPTAGLHFTDRILQELKAKGVQIAFVTLHVGLGTFLPVQVQNISDHIMHSEQFVLSEETCKLVNFAKQNGHRVISVGTTSARVLESCTENVLLSPKIGETDIFIKPGHKFQLVDALITNFHLPKSTLLMLVSAFCGEKTIKRAYEHAIKKKYRFFSYGDASFLEKGV